MFSIKKVILFLSFFCINISKIALSSEQNPATKAFAVPSAAIMHGGQPKPAAVVRASLSCAAVTIAPTLRIDLPFGKAIDELTKETPLSPQSVELTNALVVVARELKERNKQLRDSFTAYSNKDKLEWLYNSEQTMPYKLAIKLYQNPKADAATQKAKDEHMERDRKSSPYMKKHRRFHDDEGPALSLDRQKLIELSRSFLLDAPYRAVEAFSQFEQQAPDAHKALEKAIAAKKIVTIGQLLDNC